MKQSITIFAILLLMIPILGCAKIDGAAADRKALVLMNRINEKNIHARRTQLYYLSPLDDFNKYSYKEVMHASWTMPFRKDVKFIAIRNLSFNHSQLNKIHQWLIEKRSISLYGDSLNVHNIIQEFGITEPIVHVQGKKWLNIKGKKQPAPIVLMTITLIKGDPHKVSLTIFHHPVLSEARQLRHTPDYNWQTEFFNSILP